MNYFKNPYYSSAIFKCNNCSCETEVYAMDEHIDANEEKCSNCNQVQLVSSFIVIYKHNPDVKWQFHEELANVRDEKVGVCFKCLEIERMDWTEAVVKCDNCKQESMLFSRSTEGAHSEAFKSYATHCSEAYPSILVTVVRGANTYIEMKKEFSAN